MAMETRRVMKMNIVTSVKLTEVSGGDGRGTLYKERVRILLMAEFPGVRNALPLGLEQLASFAHKREIYDILHDSFNNKELN